MVMFDDPVFTSEPDKRLSSLDRGKTASDSEPSPIMAVVGFVTIPPFASIGIWGNSNPKVSPPIPGTQSGTETEIEPIAEKVLFIRVISPLIGALAKPDKLQNILTNIFLTLSHALPHSPANMFWTKSIIWVNWYLILFQTVDITVTIPLKAEEKILANQGHFSENQDHKAAAFSLIKSQFL